MTKYLYSLAALLLGSGFLFFAGGMNSLLLPVRGAEEGFSSFTLGLLGTGWALGYVLGCLRVPKMVKQVGHIRAFGVMCAFAAVSILASLLLMTPWAWIPLRAVAGFCFAGAAMIVESWLNEQSSAADRGKVFGLYTMVNLGATTAGQMMIAVGDPAGFVLFVVAGLIYVLALVPTALSSSPTPQPLVQADLDLPSLWRNSPVAVVAVALVGVSNGAFGTLGAVYADRIGLDLTTVALFMSVALLAGAAAQIPVGMVSDRVDRRWVLVGVAIVAMGADLSFLLAAEDLALTNLVAAAVLGAAIYSLYPVLAAHANDHAAPGTYLATSGGLLIIYGFGAIVGPLIAGAAMSATGPRGLFLCTIAAHILTITFTLWRMTQRAAVAEDEKTNFVPIGPTRTTTPQTMTLSNEVSEDVPRNDI